MAVTRDETRRFAGGEKRHRAGTAAEPRAE
jgi:hypothetical protein